MKYYIFKISYYNEYKNKENQIRGLVAANSYSGAVDAITKDWGGEDYIISLNFLMPIEELGDTLTLNETMFNMFLAGHNEDLTESYSTPSENDYPF